MMPRLEMVTDDRVQDTVKVWLANGSVLAFLHLVDVKLVGEIILIGISCGYTIWRWRRDAKKGPHDS